MKLKFSNPQRIVLSILIIIALLELSIVGKFRDIWGLAFTASTPPDYTGLGTGQNPPPPGNGGP